MSKTWVVPKSAEVKLERLHVITGATVRAGSVVAELRIVRFQGRDVPDGLPANPVESPADGRVLLFPGAERGAVLKEGRKVFSVLSEQDWEDLGATAGNLGRSEMVAVPVALSYEEFA
jgi:hypothetical protein